MALLGLSSRLCCSWFSKLWLVLLVARRSLATSSQAYDTPCSSEVETPLDASTSRCLIQSGALDARTALLSEEVPAQPTTASKKGETPTSQDSMCEGWQRDSARGLRMVKEALNSASVLLQRGDKPQATEAMEKALLLLGTDNHMLGHKPWQENLAEATPQARAAAQAQDDGLELARDYLHDALKALTEERVGSGAMLALGKVDIAERTTTQALMDGLRSCALGDVEKASQNLLEGLEEVKAGKRKGALAHIDNTIRVLKRTKKAVHFDMGVENLVQDHLDEAINLLIESTRVTDDTKVHPPSKDSEEEINKVLSKLKQAKYALHIAPAATTESSELSGPLVPTRSVG
mmetsp:Transcript_120199/g.208702  ORF Transcript_120199/g.208702 Transcript_120199/m.208702 type:complete len:348 (-) Transcript_120199:16-1059(-)